jgi:hypothetical protein
MNRKPVGKKDVRQTKDVSRLKKASPGRTKRRCEEETQNKKKIVFSQRRSTCLLKVKQEIYNKVKHHLTSSRGNGEINDSDDNLIAKNTPLNIISNGVESLR